MAERELIQCKHCMGINHNAKAGEACLFCGMPLQWRDNIRIPKKKSGKQSKSK